MSSNWYKLLLVRNNEFLTLCFTFVFYFISIDVQKVILLGLFDLFFLFVCFVAAVVAKGPIMDSCSDAMCLND